MDEDKIIRFTNSRIDISWLDGATDYYIASVINIYPDQIILKIDDGMLFIPLKQVRWYNIKKT